MRLPLSPAGSPSETDTATVQTGELTLALQAHAQGGAADGWDLAVTVDMSWYGQAPARVDLTRTLVRVDGMRWSPCRVPEGSPPLDSLLLDPGARDRRSFACTDIPRPAHQLDLRLHTSGTGGTGVVEVPLRPGAPVPLPSD